MLLVNGRPTLRFLKMVMLITRFFIGEKLVALMDAKKVSEDVASTIDVQVKDYAKHIKEEHKRYTIGLWDEYQVPFLFASNGRAFLEQLRTKSGIWFLDARKSANQSYPIRCLALVILKKS